MQRAGVADAGRAAEADDLEPELVEIRLEPRAGEIIAHHARTGGERSLHGGIDMQPAFHGPPGHQPGGDHDARVAGVRAARDRGDEHAPVADLRVARAEGIDREIVHRVAGGAVADHLQLAPLFALLGVVGEGIGRFQAVALLHPRAVEVNRDAERVVVRRFAIAAFRDRPGEDLPEGLLEIVQVDPVLRPLRPGHARLDIGEVEFEIDGVIDLPLARHPEHPLRLEVVFKRGALFFGAPRGGEIADRLGIHREEAHRRPVLGGHVGDRGAVGQREGLGPLAVKFDKLADDLPRAEHLGDVQREVGGGDAFAQPPGDVDADDFRREEIDRLAEHPRLRLDPADPPADDAEAVNHRGVRVGADERIRVVEIALVEHPFGEVFQVDLVDDADPRRNDAEGFKRLLAPFEELVPLPVARELHVEVQPERLGGPGEIDLHGVVHHEVHRHERLDHLRVALESGHRSAHCGEVHQQRHPREVLQDDAGDQKRDLLRSRVPGIPVRELADILLADFLAVAVAQDRFQNDPDAHGQPGDRAHARFL